MRAPRFQPPYLPLISPSSPSQVGVDGRPSTLLLELLAHILDQPFYHQARDTSLMISRDLPVTSASMSCSPPFHLPRILPPPPPHLLTTAPSIPPCSCAPSSSSAIWCTAASASTTAWYAAYLPHPHPREITPTSPRAWPASSPPISLSILPSRSACASCCSRASMTQPSSRRGCRRAAPLPRVNAR